MLSMRKLNDNRFHQMNDFNYFYDYQQAIITMARKQLRRYIWLIDTISGTNGITYEEIRRKWAVTPINDDNSDLPKRTFFDHLNAIRDEFDLEISCDRSNNTYRIDDEEVQYGSVRRSLIDSMVLNNALRECPELYDNIGFDDRFHQKNFPILLHALKERRVIQFYIESDYSELRKQAIENGDSVETVQELYKDWSEVIEFEIFGLYLCNYWYTVGMCLDDEENIYIYGIDTLKNVQIIDKHYEIPTDFDVKSYMSNFIDFDPDNPEASIVHTRKHLDSRIGFVIERDYQSPAIF